eukprot:COSAG01_NODE_6335_length_3730_cov_3.544478_5_plen_117_part_00
MPSNMTDTDRVNQRPRDQHSCVHTHCITFWVVARMQLHSLVVISQPDDEHLEQARLEGLLVQEGRCADLRVRLDAVDDDHGVRSGRQLVVQDGAGQRAAEVTRSICSDGGTYGTFY